MKGILSLLIVAAVLATACQTAPKPAATPAPVAKTETPAAAQPAPTATPAAAPAAEAPAADPSSIKAGDTGFSPLAQAPHNFIILTLHFGRPALAQTWTVEIAGPAGVVHRVKGTAPQFPPALTWDGNADDGTPAAEGSYVAKLSVDHGDGVESVQTDSILLDRTPPSGTITVTPQPFALGDPDKILDSPKVTIAVNVTPGIATVSSWRLFVVHPNGTQFMSFISEEHKDNTVLWNGRAVNNAVLEAGTVYAVTAQVFDQYGNVGNLKTSLQVAQAPQPVKPQAQAAPVTVTLDGKVIAESKVYFPAYSADLTKVSSQKQELNAQALDALAAALKAAPGSQIKVVGHANKVFWQDQAKGDVEQREVLIPLSKARAQAVRDALAARGLDATLFDLDGVGADGAVAPFGDLVNNWKNRRVEFLLDN